jgi:hypothetical protein
LGMPRTDGRKSHLVADPRLPAYFGPLDQRPAIPIASGMRGEAVYVALARLVLTKTSF